MRSHGLALGIDVVRLETRYESEDVHIGPLIVVGADHFSRERGGTNSGDKQTMTLLALWLLRSSSLTPLHCSERLHFATLALMRSAAAKSSSTTSPAGARILSEMAATRAATRPGL